MRLKSIFWILTIAFILPARAKAEDLESILALSGVNKHYSNSRMPHQVQILETGIEALQKRVEMIQNAKKSILIDYYIMVCDGPGHLIISSLYEKAKKANLDQSPIEIKILLDAMAWEGAPGIDTQLAQKLAKEGIEVLYYNDAPTVNLPVVNHRSHRKLFIIDDNEFITGGRNIADDYFDLHSGYNFLDRDIWVRGPLAAKAAESFRDFFTSSLATPPIKYRVAPLKECRGDEIDMEKKCEKSKRLNFDSIRRTENEGGIRGFIQHTQETKEQSEYEEFKRRAEACVKPDVQFTNWISGLGKSELAKSQIYTVNNISFMSDRPRFGSSVRSLGPYFRYFVEKAQSHIFFENYTYIPDPDLKLILDKKLSEKIQVDLMTDSFLQKIDIKVYGFSRKWQMDFVSKGANVWAYGGKAVAGRQNLDQRFTNGLWSIHTKSAVIDGKNVWIGTNNIDPRSQYYNAENAVVVWDNPEFAAAVLGFMNARKVNAHKMLPNGEIENFQKFESAYNLDEKALFDWAINHPLYERFY